MNKKVILLGLLASHAGLFSYTEPSDFVFHKPKISPFTATITAGTGLGVGLGTAYGIDALLHFFQITKLPLLIGGGLYARVGLVDVGVRSRSFVNLNETTIKYLITLTSLATGSFAAWWMYGKSPEGKFSKARDQLKRAIDDDLLNELLLSQENILRNIDAEYIDFAFPRVAAFNDFRSLRSNLSNAYKLLGQSIEQTRDSQLIEASHDYMAIINKYLMDIDTCIQFIKNDENWLKQIKGYELKKTREAQERAARAAEQMALNTAFNHCHCH